MKQCGKTQIGVWINQIFRNEQCVPDCAENRSTSVGRTMPRSTWNAFEVPFKKHSSREYPLKTLRIGKAPSIAINALLEGRQEQIQRNRGSLRRLEAGKTLMLSQAQNNWKSVHRRGRGQSPVLGLDEIGTCEELWVQPLGCSEDQRVSLERYEAQWMEYCDALKIQAYNPNHLSCSYCSVVWFPRNVEKRLIANIC